MSPTVRRSLAPRGRTPVLKQKGGSREKVSVIAALTLAPRRRRLGLYFRTYPKGYSRRRMHPGRPRPRSRSGSRSATAA